MAIIGSREQLCINSEVAKKESNAEKVVSATHCMVVSISTQVHLCRAKVKAHACFYYNNTDGKSYK